MFGFLFAISLTIPYFYNNALKGIALTLDIQLADVDGAVLLVTPVTEATSVE